MIGRSFLFHLSALHTLQSAPLQIIASPLKTHKCACSFVFRTKIHVGMILPRCMDDATMTLGDIAHQHSTDRPIQLMAPIIDGARFAALEFRAISFASMAREKLGASNSKSFYRVADSLIPIYSIVVVVVVADGVVVLVSSPPLICWLFQKESAIVQKNDMTPTKTARFFARMQVKLIACTIGQ